MLVKGATGVHRADESEFRSLGQQSIEGNTTPLSPFFTPTWRVCAKHGWCPGRRLYTPVSSVSASESLSLSFSQSSSPVLLHPWSESSSNLVVQSHWRFSTCLLRIPSRCPALCHWYRRKLPVLGMPERCYLQCDGHGSTCRIASLSAGYHCPRNVL